MQVPSGGSRWLLIHLRKAAQHLAGIASPHVSRQSTYTAGSSLSVSSLSVACQLARRCCQAQPVAYKHDVEQLHNFARSVLKQAQSSQGRGFSAQAVSKSGAACSWTLETLCAASSAQRQMHLMSCPMPVQGQGAIMLSQGSSQLWQQACQELQTQHLQQQ